MSTQAGGERGARSAPIRVAHMLSSVCEPGLEGVAAAAPDALRIYQLYVRGDCDYVDDHVRRAIDHGYGAFCLTVDTAIYSRRERDIAKGHVTAGRRRVSGQQFQAALDWRTVKRIKDRFDVPLVLKEISSCEDANLALEHGVEWVAMCPITGAPARSRPRLVGGIAGDHRGGCGPGQGHRCNAPFAGNGRDQGGGSVRIWSGWAGVAALTGSRRPAWPASFNCWNSWRTRSGGRSDFWG